MTDKPTPKEIDDLVYELESAQRYGLRKGERAHGIKKRDPHVE